MFYFVLCFSYEHKMRHWPFIKILYLKNGKAFLLAIFLDFGGSSHNLYIRKENSRLLVNFRDFILHLCTYFKNFLIEISFYFSYLYSSIVRILPCIFLIHLPPSFGPILGEHEGLTHFPLALRILPGSICSCSIYLEITCGL